ncbi:MAG: hypothetical protein JXK07_12785 [Spirochaetes bacterium]|nr:hypothetical protein [Spirochaetota bacterium]MBN2770505.1 hypothetical protein [Spirochaetota bacterium]
MTTRVTGKGVFQLRDDIKKMFIDLNNCYTQKITHYKDLLRNCRECSFQVSSGNYSRIEDLLEESNITIAEIDNIDYQIAAIKTSICSKCGIEYYNFESYFFYKNDFAESSHTKVLIDYMKPLLRQSIEQRDSLVKKIQVEQNILAGSIDSLSRTRAINTHFHLLQG